jgi:hypothetical protein
MRVSFTHPRFATLRLLASIVLTIGLALAVEPVPAAYAASFTPTRFDDPPPNGCVPSDCSLREAIIATNAAPSHDTIRLQSGVYVLSIPVGLVTSAADGDLNIAGDLTISGAGAGASIIDGAGIDRAFAIDVGSVRIEHVTIQNGNAHDGGGILNMSVLQLHDGIIRNNIASEHGAGIGNRGDMTLTNSIVRDNRTDDESDAGVFNAGTMTIRGSTISGNAALDNGGGVLNQGTIEIVDSVITGNSAGLGGGGMHNAGPTATAHLNNVTIAENRAQQGSGIFNAGLMTMERCRVAENRAAQGGGIFNSGTLLLSDTIVRDNSVNTFDGAGIFNTGTLSLYRSALAGNDTIEGGGGLTNRGSATVRASQVYENTTYDGSGAGIDNLGTLMMLGSDVRDNRAHSLDGGGGLNNLGVATIEGSTVRGNQAIVLGGGIRNSGTLTLTASTVAGNQATERGGGVFNLGTLRIAGSTMRDNRAIIDGGGIYNYGRVTLADSLIEGNRANSAGSAFGSGGGIFNALEGTLVLTRSIIRANQSIVGDTAGNGGGIYSAGRLTLTQSTIRDNRAGSNAGGVYNAETGVATLANSLVDSNRVDDGAGGGVRNDGELSVTATTFHGNVATEDGGGALFNAGTASISGSTLSDNHSAESGGALYNASSGSASISKSTISGNRARSEGGGIFNRGGTLHLNNVTIANNAVIGDGGGIANGLLGAVSGWIDIANSIVAGNRKIGGGNSDCLMTLNSQGYNLIQNSASCIVTGDPTGNLLGIDPRLGPLANNGGPTRTHALRPGSPAIDAGNPATPGSGGNACAAADQRGVARPQGSRCDIGAYERRIQ